jgi:hypothetical protein
VNSGHVFLELPGQGVIYSGVHGWRRRLLDRVAVAGDDSGERAREAEGEEDALDAPHRVACM